MTTEIDKVKHDMMTYGSGFMKDGKHVPISDVYIEPPIELNDEHTTMWESCYFDGAIGDLWLINLFANEYYYLMDGKPGDNEQSTDFSC